MKNLTEKEQLRLKLTEIEKSIEYAQEVVDIAYKRKYRKENWGIFSFILDEHWLLDLNVKRKSLQLKLLIENKETISDRLLAVSLKKSHYDSRNYINFEKQNELNKRIMANMDDISNRLKDRLVFLKNDKTVVEKITRQINELKYTESGLFLTIDDKNKIIDKVELLIPINEDVSSDKLRELLKKIKDKLNVK